MEPRLVAKERTRRVPGAVDDHEVPRSLVRWNGAQLTRAGSRVEEGRPRRQPGWRALFAVGGVPGDLDARVAEPEAREPRGADRMQALAGVLEDHDAGAVVHTTDGPANAERDG